MASRFDKEEWIGDYWKAAFMEPTQDKDNIYAWSFVTESLKMLDKDESGFCDFKIICKNGEEYKCHKFILASRSEYFRAMFRFEPKKETLELKDFDGPLTDIILN